MTHADPIPERDPWEDITSRFVAQMRGWRTGATAPKVNQRFPDFILPDSRGRHVALGHLLDQGPVVLSFMRGRWCPYCQQELRAWHDALPQLAAAGGQFVGISGEIGGLAEAFGSDIAPGVTMLCDVDHGLATGLGLAFPVSEEFHQRYVEAGIDLAMRFGNAGRILPIAATYVVDPAGTVRFAFVDPDFRLRADPADVIAVVKTL